MILRMHEIAFLLLTALLEVGTGLLLLIVPSVPLALLLGVNEAQPETPFVGRIAGGALLAIGVASWLARNDVQSAAQFGLLVGILIYDAAAAALLAYASLGLGMAGIALWPAVVIHSALALWDVLILCTKTQAVKHPE
jgi:hypothetical protein